MNMFLQPSIYLPLLIITTAFLATTTTATNHAGFYSSSRRCVDIPRNLSLCHDIGYPKMFMPNNLEHESLLEVSQQSASWNPLVRSKCHPDVRMFLCSLFAPVCLDEPIYPCESLCLNVKKACEPKMLAYGYSWPEMFECSKFPKGEELCIGPVAEKLMEKKEEGGDGKKNFGGWVDEYDVILEPKNGGGNGVGEGVINGGNMAERLDENEDVLISRIDRKRNRKDRKKDKKEWKNNKNNRHHHHHHHQRKNKDKRYHKHHHHHHKWNKHSPSFMQPLTVRQMVKTFESMCHSNFTALVEDATFKMADSQLSLLSRGVKFSINNNNKNNNNHKNHNNKNKNKYNNNNSNNNNIEYEFIIPDDLKKQEMSLTDLRGGKVSIFDLVTYMNASGYLDDKNNNNNKKKNRNKNKYFGNNNKKDNWGLEMLSFTFNKDKKLLVSGNYASGKTQDVTINRDGGDGDGEKMVLSMVRLLDVSKVWNTKLKFILNKERSYYCKFVEGLEGKDEVVKGLESGKLVLKFSRKKIRVKANGGMNRGGGMDGRSRRKDRRFKGHFGGGLRSTQNGGDGGGDGEVFNGGGFNGGGRQGSRKHHARMRKGGYKDKSSKEDRKRRREDKASEEKLFEKQQRKHEHEKKY